MAQPLCSSADSRVTLILLKPPYKSILKLLELQVCSLDNMITTVCCVALGSAGLLDRDHIRPRGPQLIFLDADFSSLSISCGLYVLYKAARG